MSMSLWLVNTWIYSFASIRNQVISVDICLNYCNTWFFVASSQQYYLSVFFSFDSSVSELLIFVWNRPRYTYLFFILNSIRSVLAEVILLSSSSCSSNCFYFSSFMRRGSIIWLWRSTSSLLIDSTKTMPHFLNSSGSSNATWTISLFLS